MNLTIELPDDLARTLGGLAASQHKSLQQLAIERLISLVYDPQSRSGSAAAVLDAANSPPHLSGSDIDELDAAIATARLPVTSGDPFQD